LHRTPPGVTFRDMAARDTSAKGRRGAGVAQVSAKGARTKGKVKPKALALVKVPPAVVGRPTKLNDDVARAYVEAVREGATYDLAAYSAGITRQTAHNWLRAGEAADDGPERDFFDAVKKAEAECAREALRTVRGGQMNWQASAWLLERRYREDYGRVRVEVEPVGKVAEALAQLLGVTTADLPEGGDALA
jgi:hypothetical protein